MLTFPSPWVISSQGMIQFTFLIYTGFDMVTSLILRMRCIYQFISYNGSGTTISNRTHHAVECMRNYRFFIFVLFTIIVYGLRRVFFVCVRRFTQNSYYGFLEFARHLKTIVLLHLHIFCIFPSLICQLFSLTISYAGAVSFTPLLVLELI